METSLAQARHSNRNLPEWVPASVKTYLAHVEGGNSLRQLAKHKGCHPSTVMRQVRKTEGLREDPLVDAALSALETFWRGGVASDAGPKGKAWHMTTDEAEQAKFERDTLRALKALIEPGSLLVIAEGVEDAVVVKTAPGEDRPVRKAVVSRDVAEALALREWISGQARGRLARYSISPTGRAELNRLMAAAESARAASSGRDSLSQIMPGQGAKQNRARAVGTEPPLRVLARRKRRDGAPFLRPDHIKAAERFREAFEVSRLSGAFDGDIGAVLVGQLAVPEAQTGTGGNGPVRRSTIATDSVNRVARTLGPELMQTIILACCDEIGMEQIEARMEFPARSGKVVLRIALATLARHYAAVGDEGMDLIY